MQIVQAIAVPIASLLDISLLLTVRRPDNDEDLPGVWGLPATSLKDDDPIDAAAHRPGTRKLGANVTLNAIIAKGSQERATQNLSIHLYTAPLDATSPNSLNKKARRTAPRFTLVGGGVSMNP